jgi:alkanesulfonate monooxygenase SsuD/methylene tetrahydromethanopterin reductase-like flavin-dependent oxidoreductase (luciferase family)
MQFGIFGGANAGSSAAGALMGQGFHEFVEFNIEAEALGYRSTFLTEHHFTGWHQVSSTITLLTWLAARTRTLRLGTAVIVLPWHNPVLLAEQVATLDLMSGGRVDFGVGKGYRHSEFMGFCVSPDEAEARMDESLDVITKSWTSAERFSHHGKFWQFENVVVEPPTHQKPHPPFWMAAASPPSIKKVAERGYNLILDQFGSPEQIAERIGLFRSEADARGRKVAPVEVTVARDMYVARNAAEKQAAVERCFKGRQQILNVSRAPGQERGSHILAYSHDKGPSDENTLIGTVDEIGERLQALRKSGVEYIILSCGGSREALRRFAHEIMPAFSDPVAKEAIA